MNWVKEAINDLKTHSERKAGLLNLKEQKEILEDEFVSLKGVSNGTPVSGGNSKQEIAWINNIVKRSKIESSIQITQKLVDLVENALNSLSENDRYILDLFYINRTYDYKDRLCEKFNVEEAQIYRMKDTALKNFTICMYGITEI